MKMLKSGKRLGLPNVNMIEIKGHFGIELTRNRTSVMYNENHLVSADIVQLKYDKALVGKIQFLVRSGNQPPIMYQNLLLTLFLILIVYFLFCLLNQLPGSLSDNSFSFREQCISFREQCISFREQCICPLTSVNFGRSPNFR